MMKRLTAALLLLLALGPDTVLATPDRHAGHTISVAQAPDISLDQAVEQVRRETGGRILSAETVRKNGRKVHRLKLLTPDHKVRIIHIEANGDK